MLVILLAGCGAGAMWIKLLCKQYFTETVVAGSTIRQSGHERGECANILRNEGNSESLSKHRTGNSLRMNRRCSRKLERGRYAWSTNIVPSNTPQPRPPVMGHKQLNIQAFIAGSRRRERGRSGRHHGR